MGGKEASRGFLYQGFASVLESLTQKFWDEIYVEYPTEGDKVDIALKAGECIIKAIQVKSSINPFEKGKLIEWIKLLTSDVDAEEYQICLIGACDKNTAILVNSLEKHYSGTSDKTSKEALKDIDITLFDNHNISIKVLPFDESILQQIVRDSLNRYISFKGYTLDFQCLDLLSQAALCTKMVLGTKGKSETRKEFDENLFKWIDRTSGNSLKSIVSQAKHELAFYFVENKEVSDIMNECNICSYYNYKKYISKYNQDCIKLISEINNIQLKPHKQEEKPKKKISDINSSLILQTTDINIENLREKIQNIDFQAFGFGCRYAEFKEDDKEEHIKDIKLYFDIDIDKDFFNVGDLKEEIKYGVFGKKSYVYHGTETEEYKNDMINKLSYKISKYKVIEEFRDNMKMCSIVPIVINNISDILDKNITIKLFIPKADVKLFESNLYPYNDYVKYILSPFCEEDESISNVFKLKADSKVSIETKAGLIYEVSDYEYTSSDFYKELDKYIASNNYEDDNFYIIEYRVEELRPQELKYLNKLILLYSLERDTEIKYKILSDNTDGSNEGVLSLKKTLC